MAKKPSPEIIRRDISSALLQLSQVLQTKTDGVIVNPDVLKSSANSVGRKNQGSLWAYEVAGLMLRVDLPQNSLPANCSGPLTIEMNLELSGDCDRLDDGDLNQLILNLSITSAAGDNICAWHFDRHIGDEGASVEAHPLYHFQHGGHAMKIHDQYLGRSLLLPAPRLAFPPMDAILAIDFVLSNFSGNCWRDLRDEPVYLRLLRESQKAFWKPYIRRLSSWWDTGPKDAKNIVSLFPQLA